MCARTLVLWLSGSYLNGRKKLKNFIARKRVFELKGSCVSQPADRPRRAPALHVQLVLLKAGRCRAGVSRAVAVSFV